MDLGAATAPLRNVLVAGEVMRANAMKLFAIIIATGLFAMTHAEARGGGRSSSGSHSVSGHFRSNGTYVQPHRATNPNTSKLDNWSTRGNVNPYTGQSGTKNPF